MSLIWQNFYFVGTVSNLMDKNECRLYSEEKRYGIEPYGCNYCNCHLCTVIGKEKQIEENMDE